MYDDQNCESCGQKAKINNFLKYSSSNVGSRKRSYQLPINSCPQIYLCPVTSNITQLKIRFIFINSIQWKGKCKASKGKVIYIPAKICIYYSDNGEISTRKRSSEMINSAISYIHWVKKINAWSNPLQDLLCEIKKRFYSLNNYESILINLNKNTFEYQKMLLRWHCPNDG